MNRYIQCNFCLNFVDNLYKDLTRQEIDEKIQSFHVNEFKKKCVTLGFQLNSF